jgi:hypothetical protein
LSPGNSIDPDGPFFMPLASHEHVLVQRDPVAKIQREALLLGAVEVSA